MTESSKRYLICLSNDGYQTSLEPRKVYVALRDDEALKRGFVRVVDESGEDYLFPEGQFAAIELPHDVERAFAASG